MTATSQDSLWRGSLTCLGESCFTTLNVFGLHAQGSVWSLISHSFALSTDLVCKSTPDVTCTLGQVQARILYPNPTPICSPFPTGRTNKLWNYTTFVICHPDVHIRRSQNTYILHIFAPACYFSALGLDSGLRFCEIKITEQNSN